MKAPSIFKRLREKLFGRGKSNEAPAAESKLEEKGKSRPRVRGGGTVAVVPAEPASERKQAERPPPGPAPEPDSREPYLFQVGFDFGTAYSKCIYRDVLKDRAIVFVPAGSEGERPFLIPSALRFQNGRLSHQEQDEQYVDDGLYHLKMALEKVALEAWDDDDLQCFSNRSDIGSGPALGQFVRSCAVYFLAGALGEIRAQVLERWSDFGADSADYMGVTMAVPAANAEQEAVGAEFRKVLRLAWVLADGLKGHPEIRLEELDQMIQAAQEEGESESVRQACDIYPEVSANVQGFVRSRTSQEGIYLFSDTGAGTVDQSVFVFARPNGEDFLTYLHASVLPLGSGHIEQRAARRAGDASWRSLEEWRMKKEAGDHDSQLEVARNQIASELRDGTRKSIALAKKKLPSPGQLTETKILFGGGGDCAHPYRQAVIRPFNGNQFREPVNPDVIGLPLPRDLELTESQRRWLPRLSVAYGLSFEKSMLAGFRFPKDVKRPKPEEIWRPKAETAQAVSKDEC